MKEQVRQFIKDGVERKKQGKPRLSADEIKKLVYSDLKEIERTKKDAKWTR